MGKTRKILVGAGAVAGLLTASQAPEFSQQYRQRLGGAVAELKVVTEDFDRDAAASSLTRQDALRSMRRSENAFSRDRGESMTRTINRYEALAKQLQTLETAPPVLRPFGVLVNPDKAIANEAWKIFEPAVPVTLSGITWGALGALVLGFVTWLFIGLLNLLTRGGRKGSVIPKPVASDLQAPRLRMDH